MTNFRTPSFWDARPGESAEAHRRRVSQFAHHRDDAQADADQAHAEFRQQREARVQGSDSGIFGNLTGQELAAARGLVGAGHGGEQRPEKLGHLASTTVPGQRGAIRRIMAQDIHDAEDQPGVSPLLAHMRGQQ
jgi:hypothetical protein